MWAERLDEMVSPDRKPEIRDFSFAWVVEMRVDGKGKDDNWWQARGW